MKYKTDILLQQKKKGFWKKIKNMYKNILIFFNL